MQPTHSVPGVERAHSEREQIDRLHRPPAAGASTHLAADAGARVGGDMKGEHHWTNVKKVERVYQKLKRSYNRRCHRAFVIVRSTLIFDDLSGIAKILGAITNDVNRVTVLRVKNRYDPSFVRTDGYRDVALLLTGPALQNFVCELQLDLRVMFEVKQAGGRGTN